MKLTRHLRLAAFVFLGQLLMAGNSAGQTYEFQCLTSDAQFSPTYLWITAALNTPVSAASSIENYEINTKLGTWTPQGFVSKQLPSEDGKAPFWASGVAELENNGNTLVFLTKAELESFPIGLGTVDERVYLTSTSVSPVALGTLDGSTGTWSLVSATGVPEAADTFWLLLLAATGLGVYRRFMSYRAEL